MWLAYSAGSGARRCGLPGDLLVGVTPNLAARDGRLHRHAAGLLLRPQARAGARHLHRVVGVSAAGDRRWRRRRHPAVPMVPADGDGIRRRCSWSPASATPSCNSAERTGASDPQIAGVATPTAPTCGSSGRCRRQRWCCAAGMWAFERDHSTTAIRWFVVSMVPFTIAILRYAVDVDGGLAGRARRHCAAGPGVAAAVSSVDRNSGCRSLPSAEARSSRPSSAEVMRRRPVTSCGVAGRRFRTTSWSGSAYGSAWRWSPCCSAERSRQRRWIADDLD